MRQPLVVYLCWHPESSGGAASLVEECYKRLCRDPDRPFSRGMQIPVFYRSVVAFGGDKPLPIKFAGQERTAIFIFVGDAVVASNSWNSYIEETLSSRSVSSKNHRIFVIALTPNAMNLPEGITRTNFIRLYDYRPAVKDKALLVHMAHELCRLLQGMPSFTESGSRLAERSVRLFLSHAKMDEQALLLARAIKRLLEESTTLARFFDQVDINPGADFATEIEASIKDSTVICIKSDSYSSRPWCQKEILTANKSRRPLISVDIVDSFEDRVFPYLGNIHSIRLKALNQGNERDLFIIIESALLETLRCYYAQDYLEFLKRHELIPEKAIILPHPPESIDIGVLEKDYPNAINIIYPDPPLMSDEVELIKNDNCSFSTPLTTDMVALDGLKVGVSVSEPEMSDLATLGMDGRHIRSFLNELTRYLLLFDAQLLYGGRLSGGGFTEFLFETAKYLKTRYKKPLRQVRNYFAWPYNLDLDESEIAINKSVAEFVIVDPPDDVYLQITDLKEKLPCDTVPNRVIRVRCLEEMRHRLINDSEARISVGGRCFGYTGRYPGILEEALLAVEMQKPLYILGGFGGASQQVSLALQGKEAPKLTMACQSSHELNSGYADMVSAYNGSLRDSGPRLIDYEAAMRRLSTFGIAGLSRLNGLTKDENLLLLETSCLEEAIVLLLKGLRHLSTKAGKVHGGPAAYPRKDEVFYVS
jgi:hypothetical protein